MFPEIQPHSAEHDDKNEGCGGMSYNYLNISLKLSIE